MGGSAPASDPRIGIAAVQSSRIGRNAMKFLKSQAKISNKWARQDRNRDLKVFRPMQNKFIKEAKNWDSPERRANAQNQAQADVENAAAGQRGQQERQMMSMGVNPASGRFQEAAAKGATDTALAVAGARNVASRQIGKEAEAKQAEAINLGMGLGINPATSLGLSNNAIGAAGQAGMQGQQQMGNLLNQDYQNRMAAYQSNQGGIGSLFSGLGSLAGMAFGSSKDIKHDKKPVDALEMVEKMPVEQWTYDKGQGDGGTHIGPYAEDFAKVTGKGDGKSIDVISMMGVTMGAVKDLSKRIDDLQMGAAPRKRAA